MHHQILPVFVALPLALLGFRGFDSSGEFGAGNARGNGDPREVRVSASPASVATAIGTQDPQDKVGRGVPQGDGDWTVFTPSTDTRIVYVSTGGNDANDGLSESTPKRTIAAARRLVRQNYPDWLLLRRGEVFDESLGYWNASGRSEREPVLISSYGPGTTRPLLRTGSGHGIDISPTSTTPPQILHVAIVGLHFQPHTYTGGGSPVGLRFVHVGGDYLVEDCCLEGYHTNAIIQGFGGRLTNVRLRRCTIIDAYTTLSSHSQGLYADAVDGLLLEENVFDHNGWSERVAGADANIFRHSLYVQNGSTGVVVKGNIIASSSSHGLQLRCGGVAVDNLFLRNPIALLIGGGTTPEPNGIEGKASLNVILDGKNINAGNPRGWGLNLTNINRCVISSNIIANQTLATQPVAMELLGDRDGLGIHQTTIENNVVSNWGGTVRFTGNAAQVTGITFTRNDLQNLTSSHPLLVIPDVVSSFKFSANRFHSSQAAASAWLQIGGTMLSFDAWRTRVGDSTSVSDRANYPDGNASIGSYHATLSGPPTHDAFMLEARKQSKANWRPEYTAHMANVYFRKSFGLHVD